MTPFAASWSSSFTVFFSSVVAFSLSVIDRTRFMALRMRDFHWMLRAAWRFACRALFSADSC